MLALQALAPLPLQELYLSNVGISGPLDCSLIKPKRRVGAWRPSKQLIVGRQYCLNYLFAYDTHFTAHTKYA
jgi:hypothetical protein